MTDREGMDRFSAAALAVSCVGVAAMSALEGVDVLRRRASGYVLSFNSTPGWHVAENAVFFLGAFGVMGLLVAGLWRAASGRERLRALIGLACISASVAVPAAVSALAWTPARLGIEELFAYGFVIAGLMTLVRATSLEWGLSGAAFTLFAVLDVALRAFVLSLTWQGGGWAPPLAVALLPDVARFGAFALLACAFAFATGLSFRVKRARESSA